MVCACGADVLTSGGGVMRVIDHLIIEAYGQGTRHRSVYSMA